MSSACDRSCNQSVNVMDDESSGRTKARLIEDKFKWLQQVANDARLPPAAAPIAIFIASKFLNSRTGEAYPSILTLAAIVGRGVTQTRAAIRALVDRKHLELVPSRGGAHRTNRYKIVLKPLGNPKGYGEGEHSGNPKGYEERKPLGNLSKTLRKPEQNPSGIRRKPLGNPKGIPFNNPCEYPFDESASGGGPPAQPPPAEQRCSSSRIYTSDTTHREGFESPPRVGQKIADPEFGECIVEQVQGQVARVRSVKTGLWHTRDYAPTLDVDDDCPLRR